MATPSALWYESTFYEELNDHWSKVYEETRNVFLKRLNFSLFYNILLEWTRFNLVILFELKIVMEQR